MARKTTCMTETSVTKYISARTDGPEFMERHGSLFPSERVDFGFRRSFLLFIERFIDDLKFLL